MEVTQAAVAGSAAAAGCVPCAAAVGSPGAAARPSADAAPAAARTSMHQRQHCRSHGDCYDLMCRVSKQQMLHVEGGQACW